MRSEGRTSASICSKTLSLTELSSERSASSGVAVAHGLQLRRPARSVGDRARRSGTNGCSGGVDSSDQAISNSSSRSCPSIDRGDERVEVRVRTARANSGGGRTCSAGRPRRRRGCGEQRGHEVGALGEQDADVCSLPMPACSSRFDSRRDCSSADPKVNRLSGVTT